MKIIIANGDGGEKIRNLMSNKNDIICCESINDIVTCLKMRNDVGRIVIFDASLENENGKLIGKDLVDCINNLYKRVAGTSTNILVVTQYEDIADTIETSCSEDIIIIKDGPKYSAVRLEEYVNGENSKVKSYRYSSNITVGTEGINVEQQQKEWEDSDEFESLEPIDEEEPFEETDRGSFEEEESEEDIFEGVESEEEEGNIFEEEEEESLIEGTEEQDNIDDTFQEIDKTEEQEKKERGRNRRSSFDSFEEIQEKEQSLIDEDESFITNSNKKSKPVKNKKSIFSSLGNKGNKNGDIVDIVSKRGNIITFMGTGGQGTTTIAYNVAAELISRNYRVAYLDLSTSNRGSVVINKNNFDAMNYDDIGVTTLLNTGKWEQNINTVYNGIDISAIGIAADEICLANNVDEKAIARSLGILKRQYNFIIVDCELRDVTEFAKDIINYSDSLNIVMDYSTWGVGKLIAQLYNISDDDISDIIFKKAGLIINGYRNGISILGDSRTNPKNIKEKIDAFADTISEGSNDSYIRSMGDRAVVRYIESADNNWFTSKELIRTNSDFKNDICALINTLF